MLLISSRLDFGNSVFFNLPQTQLSMLQRLQNAAARIIALSKKHITPILRSLHCLKVKDRIIFKILLLTLHCIQGTARQYNIDLLHDYIPAIDLYAHPTPVLLKFQDSLQHGAHVPLAMLVPPYGITYPQPSKIVHQIPLKTVYKLTCLMPPFDYSLL